MDVSVNNITVTLTDISSVIEWKEKTEREVDRLTHKLKEKKETLDDIYKYLHKNCKHEIVHDFVDQMDGYKLSIPITYCTKCNLSFNKKY